MFKLFILCLAIVLAVCQREVEISMEWGDWTEFEYFQSGVYACGAFIYGVQSQGRSRDDIAAFKIGFYGCNATNYEQNGKMTFEWDGEEYFNARTRSLYSGTAFCPEGQFIFNFKLRVEGKQYVADDTSVNGLSILCQNPLTGEASEVLVNSGIWGSWEQGAISDDDLYVCGASAKFEEFMDYYLSDNTALTGLKVKRCAM